MQTALQVTDEVVQAAVIKPFLEKAFLRKGRAHPRRDLEVPKIRTQVVSDMYSLTHFYRRGTEPFRSLSALPDTEAVRIMEGLYVEGSVIWERFKDPCEYLQARRLTERWLRQEFIAKGGEPQELYPIYMVVGRPKWIARMADAATLATTAEIQVPLSIFGEGDVSFTYPDSMVTLLMESQKNPEYYQPDYHGKLFTLSEILAIILAKGLPDEGWETNVPSYLAHYIEAQVWNRRLLLEY